MSILDELKAQADKKHSELGGFSSNKEKQLDDYRKEILPKMQYIYTYFKEIIDYLSVIETPIEVNNYCDKLPALGVLKQQDYRLTTDKHGGIADFEKIEEVNLNYVLKGTSKVKGKNNEELVYAKDSQLDVEKEHRLLTSNNIPYTFARSLKTNNEETVIFRVNRTIPVAFKFLADTAKSTIVLKIQNHENFEARAKNLKLDQINEAYLEKLASYMLRKNNNLMTKKMDDSSRDKIRQKIKAEKQEKERQLEIAEQRDRLKQQELKKQKITYKLKSFFKSRSK